MTPRLSGPRPATVELGGFGEDASRLRCSPTAALNLRNAIDASLKMLETAASTRRRNSIGARSSKKTMTIECTTLQALASAAPRMPKGFKIEFDKRGWRH